MVNPILESDAIVKFCARDNMESYDPYDIWKSSIGFSVKQLYNRSKLLGAGPAFLCIGLDLFLNNRLRIGYTKTEYPMVRAYAAQILLLEYSRTGHSGLLTDARRQIDWLIAHTCTGYSGYCWGANIKWASKSGFFNENTPFITNTPYVTEALHGYYKITGDQLTRDVLVSTAAFVNHDLKKCVNTPEKLAFSYSPEDEFPIVVNATSYAAFNLMLVYDVTGDSSYLNDVKRAVRFLCTNQNSDGSWYYYQGVDEKDNFIDCFHSCFILKNLLKIKKLGLDLPEIDHAIQHGVSYMQNFKDRNGLYRRFSKKNKLGLIHYDLYDNAEIALVLAMIGRKKDADELLKKIELFFVRQRTVYSAIDIFGVKRNPGMLRWAVMPFFFSKTYAEKNG